MQEQSAFYVEKRLIFYPESGIGSPVVIYREFGVGSRVVIIRMERVGRRSGRSVVHHLPPLASSSYG